MEKNSVFRKKTEKTLIAWSVVSLALVLVVPLIYWDALGSGALLLRRGADHDAVSALHGCLQQDPEADAVDAVIIDK